jgi:hypothetical protein
MNKKEVIGYMLGLASFALLMVFFEFNSSFYSLQHGRMLGWVNIMLGIGSCISSIVLLLISIVKRGVKA